MTDGDSIAQFIWLALVLLLVVSSLTARRIPLMRLITWAGAWVALFLGVYLLFNMLGPQINAWQQDRRSGTVSGVADTPQSSAGHVPEIRTDGSDVHVPISEDGHFWVDASINGQTVRFLIDSGATITAVSDATATMIGLAPDPMNRTAVMQTANGAVTARRSAISAMRIGTIQAADLPVVISASFGEVNVLGMNFLNKLRSWRVEGGTMVLQPH